MTREIKVGLISFFILAVLFIFVFYVGQISFAGDGKQYVVKFKFLDGLRPDAAVRIAGGIDIGFVDHLSTDGEYALVHVQISAPDIIITDDAKFYIYSESLLGGKYIQVETEAEGEPLEEKTIIRGVDPTNMSQVFSKVGKTFDSFSDKGDKASGAIGQIGGMIEGLNNFIVNINKILESPKVSGILTNIESLTAKADTLVTSVDGIVEKVDTILIDGKDIVKNDLRKLIKEADTVLGKLNVEIAAISEESKALLFDVKRGFYDVMEGSDGFNSITKETKSLIARSGRDINDILENVAITSRKLDRLVRNVNKVTSVVRKGLAEDGTTLSTVVKDKKLAKDLKDTVNNLKTITDDIRKSFLFSEEGSRGTVSPYTE